MLRIRRKTKRKSRPSHIPSHPVQTLKQAPTPDKLHQNDDNLLDASPQNLLYLQRTIGNQAVQRIMSQQPGTIIQRDYFDDVSDMASPDEVRIYVDSLMSGWTGFFTSKSSRRKKAQALLAAARSSEERMLVRLVYFDKFNEELKEGPGEPERIAYDMNDWDTYRDELDSILTSMKRKRAIIKKARDDNYDFDKSTLLSDLNWLLEQKPVDNLTGFAIQQLITTLSEGESLGEDAGLVDLDTLLPEGVVSASLFKGVAATGNLEKATQKGTIRLNGNMEGSVKLGANLEGTAKYTRDKTSITGSYDVKTLLGLIIQGKTEGEIATQFFKLSGSATGDLQIGGGFNSSGSLTASLTQLKAQLLADAFLGIKVGGNAKARLVTKKGGVGIELEGDAKGFAGAEVEAGLAAQLDKSGLKLDLKGGAFAGARAEATGTVRVIVGGRSWGSVTGKASANAGVGATGKLGLQIGLGKIVFDTDAGVTLGVGTDVGVAGALDFAAMKDTAKDAYDYLKNYKAYSQGYTKMDGKPEHLKQISLAVRIFERQLKEADMQVGQRESPSETTGLLENMY